MSLETFIRRYYFEDLEVCDRIIQWFEANKAGTLPGCTYNPEKGGRIVDTRVKESEDYSLHSLEEAISLCPDFLPLLNFLWDCINNYIRAFPEVDNQKFQIVPFNMQAYTPPNGGFKQFHCERSSLFHARRNLVWMIYLNTVTDQGGTEFKYQKLIEPAEAGKVLIWPPDFTHTHRGIPSPTQKKYILTGWYEFID